MDIVLQVLGMGVTSAVVGSLLTSGIGALGKRRERIRKANYSAIQLTTHLDRFAYECADAISAARMENARYHTYGNEPSVLCEVPSLEFPKDIAWESLYLPLVQRGLATPNDRQKAISYIKAVVNAGDEPDELHGESEEQVAILGFRAHQLATDIRLHYPLSKGGPNVYPWDYVETLKELHDSAIAKYDSIRQNYAPKSGQTAVTPPAPPVPSPPLPRGIT